MSMSLCGMLRGGIQTVNCLCRGAFVLGLFAQNGMSIKIRRQNIDLEYIDLEYKGWENVCKNKTLYKRVTLLEEYTG